MFTNKLNMIQENAIAVAKKLKDLAVAHPKEAIVAASAMVLVAGVIAVVCAVKKHIKKSKTENEKLRDSILKFFTGSKKTTVTFQTTEEVLDEN